MRVFVYFNLHRKCYSIKALSGPCKGRVIAHADRVLIRDAEFHVSEAGRQRVLKTGRKNVHAGVVGELEAHTGDFTQVFRREFPWLCIYAEVTNGWTGGDRRYARYALEEGETVTYNPRKWDRFMTCDRGRWSPVYEADMVYMKAVGTQRGVYTFDPCDMPEQGRAA